LDKFDQWSFSDLDAEAVEIDRYVCELWLRMADICIEIQDHERWAEGFYECPGESCEHSDHTEGWPKGEGTRHRYSSYGDWLLRRCPRSRSWVYLAVGRRKELPYISDADLKEIPLGNTEPFVLGGREAQTNRKLLEAAKSQGPSEFLTTVSVLMPQAHLESKVTVKFPKSQLEAIDRKLDYYRQRVNDPAMPRQLAIEGLVNDYPEVCERLDELERVVEGRK